MTHFGKIKSYDRDLDTGMITPDTGGDALPFDRMDLQLQGPAPSVGQRFGFETSEVGGGTRRAIKLLLKQGSTPSLQEQQARAQRG